MILGIAYSAALLLALYAALSTGYRRLFPLWSLWLALTTYQTIAATVVDPQDTGWWLNWWAPVEKATLAAAALAVAEALHLRTRNLPEPQRFWLRFGVAVTPLSVVAYFARVPHSEPFREFLIWREWIWVWLALTCVTGWLFFFWRAAVVPEVIRYHTGILTNLMLMHAFAAPQINHGMYVWFYWQTIYRVAALVCAVAWMLNAGRLARQTAGRDAPRHDLYVPRYDPSALRYGTGHSPVPGVVLCVSGQSAFPPDQYPRPAAPGEPQSHPGVPA